MAELRRQFHYHASGHLGQYEDWWVLVFDPDTGDIFIEHSWDHVSVSGSAEPRRGESRVELLTYLTSENGSSAKNKLVALLKTLFP